MFDHDIVSLPAGQDMSNSALIPVGTRVKWTVNGVMVASAGDVAIGTLWRGNDSQQIANLYTYVGNSGPAVAVKMFFSNGIPWGIIGSDANPFNQGDTLSAADNGTYVHPGGGSAVVAQVLYGAPGGSQGGQISVIPLIGIQAFLAFIIAFLAFLFLMAPTPSYGAAGDIVSLVRTGTENQAIQTVLATTGTDTAPNLPVASAPFTYYSVGTTGTGPVYYKETGTTLLVSGTYGAALTSPSSPPYVLTSGTITYQFSPNTTTNIVDVSGTATQFVTLSNTNNLFATTSGTTQLSGTTFTLMNAYGATVTGSASLSATGGWVNLSSTNPSIIAQ